MKILVTGASGFIGREVCKRLFSETDYEIVSASRSFNQNIDTIKQINISKIDKSTNWDEALKNCNTVIHLASISHVSKSKKNKIRNDYMSINYDGSINLFNQSIKNNVKKFIFVSSIKVNGDFNANNADFKFDDIPNPQNVYSQIKLKTEKKLISNSKNNNIELIILRPALVYGENIKGNLLTLYRWIHKSYPFLVINNDFFKSFLSIDNFITALILTIKVKNIKNEILLLSDPKPVTLIELLKKIAKYQNKKLYYFKINKKILYLIFYLFRKKDIYNSLYLSSSIDINRTKKILKWEPKDNFDECLKKSIEFFEKNQIEKKND